MRCPASFKLSIASTRTVSSSAMTEVYGRYHPTTRLLRLFPRAPAPHAYMSGWVFVGYIDEYGEEREACYACLERPCACIEGWVFVGYIDEDGQEREASYPAAVAGVADSPRSDNLRPRPTTPPAVLAFWRGALVSTLELRNETV
jgi:hypothetical protein